MEQERNMYESEVKASGMQLTSINWGLADLNAIR